MRGSGWALPVLAAVAWLAAVGVPGGALVLAAATPAEPVEVRRAAELLATSAGWALAVAIGAMLVGWIPGQLLASGLRRGGYVPLAVLMLAPICLPAYVIFYAWWQAWPADSALHEWAIETGRLGTAKAATLGLGLLCWSWPIVAWCVAASASSTPAERRELLELDGAGPVRRAADRLRTDGRGLLLGGLIVFLFVFNNTTSFDIAQIFTFGYELSAIDALGAGARALVAAALPATIIAVAGAAAVWMLLGRREPETPLRAGRLGAGAVVVTGAILALSVVVPVLLFVGNLSGEADVATFLRLYGTDLVNTAAIAIACALAGGTVALGLAATWQDHRRWVRAVGHVQAVGYLAAGLVPGILVGTACEAAYNRPGLDGVVYTTPAILVIGYLARFGFIAALLGRWVTMTEPRDLRDLRRLDGATDLPGFLASAWPRILAAAGASGAVIGVLSMSELAVTARLAPSGFAVIARAVLNAVHYQRPDTVLLATVSLMVIGLVAGLLAVAAWSPLRRGSWGLSAVVLAGSLALGGCRPQDAGGARPLEVQATFGSPGLSLGQFDYPRGIAVDATRGLLYVVDKTARVQRYDLEGNPQLQWRMPEWENGKPTGLGVAPDGRVFVADTHYHRVIAYDTHGRELMRFGQYGQEPGQFIYPTDVAFGPEGRIYVSEYGGNERIGVFGADGRFLFSFGSFGSEVGQFNRPQAMTFDAEGTELFVADSCNHRVVVVTPDGKPLRVIGGPGRGPGELAYPYDVMMLDDRTLLVCEFCTDDEIFVLDSGNNRVQVIESDW